jgi:hypothetical protein
MDVHLQSKVQVTAHTIEINPPKSRKRAYFKTDPLSQVLLFCLSQLLIILFNKRNMLPINRHPIPQIDDSFDPIFPSGPSARHR